ncbi:MAG: DUF5787 family protein [Halobacteriaceae archaeon]
MREFGFELRLCAHLEAAGGVVARQLGASVGGHHRVMDVVRVLPGPEFDERVALSPDTVPPAAIEAEVGLTWTPVTAAFEGPPARARALAERAVEAGFLERERRDGRDVVRQAARYPDWFSRLVGVENKPDIDDDTLPPQLRRDVALGLFDAVVVATESYVTRAHLNRLPDPVGVWRVDFDRADPVEVVREPASLPSGEPGLQVVAEHAGRTEVEPVGADEKARQRRRVAERAYGKGWRPAFPACARAEPREARGASLPYCPWKGRLVDAGADCGPDCGGHDPAEPPDVDSAAERAANTPWEPDPDGRARRQAGLGEWARE